MLAMRDRDRANKNEIEIFVFSVTSNDFPHDMLQLTFSSNLGSIGSSVHGVVDEQDYDNGAQNNHPI